MFSGPSFVDNEQFRQFVALCHFIFGLVGFAADKVVYKWISQDSSEAVEKDPGMMISEFDLGSIRTFETTSYYKLGMMTYDGMVIGQFFSNSPLYKREGNWTQLTFAKTSGTVTRNRENVGQQLHRRIPSNNPRNNCGTHFCPCSLLRF